jgi:dihydrofolate reductase
MRKLIAAINVSLDGNCDHTVGIPDDELHRHYSDLLRGGGAILYGRITYQLMESYWPEVLKNPTGNPATDGFAAAIQGIPKIVFSRTLKKVQWDTARLAQGGLKEEVLELKRRPGKDILVGSPGLIVDLMKLGLVDELQLCVHPVLAGSGKQLFHAITKRTVLKLVKTKVFAAGQIILYYSPH